MLLSAASAAAQTSDRPLADDPVGDARIQLGPVGLNPTLAIRDVGIDTNVFYSEARPQRDFVAVIAPGTSAAMRLGRGVLSGNVVAEWAYFQKDTSQRSVNLSQDGRFELRLTRLTPHIEAAYHRTRQRPNLEIDQRVLQKLPSVAAGVALHVGPGTTVDLNAGSSRIDYGQRSAAPNDLATALNRRTVDYGLDLHRALTGQTALIASARVRRDRFEFDPVRDADNVVVTTGVDMKPSALISGSARAGYRQLRSTHPGTPDYGGAIAAVDLRYVMLEETRFVVSADRDVDYSYELDWPFFVATGASLEIKQALGFLWDVVARGGRSELQYRPFSLVATTLPNEGQRRDTVTTVGLGAGRHLGDNLRLGVDVTRERRVSAVAAHSYQRYRVGGSLSYDF